MVHLRKLHSVPIVVVCIVFFFVSIILACYFNRQKLEDILNTYKLIPQPKRYTELYLDNHDSLPLLLEPEQIATASFTILNKEGTTEAYRYVITSTRDAESEIVASGSARLNDNEAVSIPFTLQVATTEPKTRFDVTLSNKKQRVHFWVNNL